jgi:maltooligosyltrehalose trehalohydrolase
MHRWHDADQVFYLMNFGDRDVTLEPDLPTGSWQKLLDSASTDWAGPGSTLPEQLSAFQPITVKAKSFALYQA